MSYVLQMPVMCLLRPSSGEVRRRAVPVPMSVRGTYSNGSPTRHDLYFHNSKLKTGHQAPMDSPQIKPASSAHTARAADALSASLSDNTAGLRPANGAAASSHSSVAQPSQLLSHTKGMSSADWVVSGRARSMNRVDDGMQQVYSNVEPVLTTTQDGGHSSSSNGSVCDPNLPSGAAQAATVLDVLDVHASTAAQSGDQFVPQSQSPRVRQPGAALHKLQNWRAAQHGDMMREVMLSDEVRDFLAQPISGPCRPIIFDLETTGTDIPECPPCCVQTSYCSTFCPSIQDTVFGTWLWFYRPARNPVQLSSILMITILVISCTSQAAALLVSCQWCSPCCIHFKSGSNPRAGCARQGFWVE